MIRANTPNLSLNWYSINPSINREEINTFALAPDKWTMSHLLLALALTVYVIWFSLVRMVTQQL